MTKFFEIHKTDSIEESIFVPKMSINIDYGTALVGRLKREYGDAVDEAFLNLLENFACPQNARRLERNLPCSVTGKCTDCRSDERMCNVTTIIEGNIPTTDIRICIVGENLGY